MSKKTPSSSSSSSSSSTSSSTSSTLPLFLTIHTPPVKEAPTKSQQSRRAKAVTQAKQKKREYQLMTPPPPQTKPSTLLLPLSKRVKTMFVPKIKGWTYNQKFWQRYKLVLTSSNEPKLLGEGTFGRVVLAVDMQSKERERVAIKLLQSNMPQHELQLLEHEINALELLSKRPDCTAYVACYYEHAIVDTPPYKSLQRRHETKQQDYQLAIVMEYVQGDRFDVFMKTHSPQPALVNAVLLMALEGLNYIHSHGVAHNDIKPENIMIMFTYDNPQKTSFTLHGVKYIDFGFACNVSTCWTGPGTPVFIAPDMYILRANGRRALNQTVFFKNDVWGLGASFLEWLIGKEYIPVSVDDVADLMVINQYLIAPTEIQAKYVKLNPALLNHFKARLQENMRKLDKHGEAGRLVKAMLQPIARRRPDAETLFGVAQARLTPPAQD